MKEWNIDEFVRECENLCKNPYTYDYNRMPDGTCNGHNVRPYMPQISSIVIDNSLVNMGVINDRYPKGSLMYGYKGMNLTSTEYIRIRLSDELA